MQSVGQIDVAVGSAYVFDAKRRDGKAAVKGMLRGGHRRLQQIKKRRIRIIGDKLALKFVQLFYMRGAEAVPVILKTCISFQQKCVKHMGQSAGY